MCNKSIPETEKPHYLVVSVWSGGSDTNVHHVDSGIFEALKIGGSKCLRIGEPGWALISLEGCQHAEQRERVQHVHYCAAFNQIDGSDRIFSRGFCEELKPASVDHGCPQCRSSNSEEAFQRLTTRYHASVEYDNLRRHWQWRDT